MSETINATEAIDRLDPEKWAQTGPNERLRLLEEVRDNCQRYGDALAASDAAMKNDLMGEELYNAAISKVATVVPIANTLSACIELYEHLVDGEMPGPISVTPVGDGLHDVHVFPSSRRDRLMNQHRPVGGGDLIPPRLRRDQLVLSSLPRLDRNDTRTRARRRRMTVPGSGS